MNAIFSEANPERQTSLTVMKHQGQFNAFGFGQILHVLRTKAQINRHLSPLDWCKDSLKAFLMVYDFQICSQHLRIWKHVQTVKQVYNYTHSLNFRIQMYSHNGGDERAATLKPDFTAHSNSIFSRLTKGPRADEHSPGWDVQRPPIDLVFGCF